MTDQVEKQSCDTIDHPSHYSRWAMEPVEFTAVNNLPWWLHNVIKYTMRFDAKDGLQDLYKARSYLEMKIRQLEGHERFWDKPVSEQRELSVFRVNEKQAEGAVAMQVSPVARTRAQRGLPEHERPPLGKWGEEYWQKHKQEQANRKAYQEAIAKADIAYPKYLYEPVSPYVAPSANAYEMPEYTPPARYCSCGVNITAEGFSCWDDDCMHKIKSSSKIHCVTDCGPSCNGYEDK